MSEINIELDSSAATDAIMIQNMEKRKQMIGELQDFPSQFTKMEAAGDASAKFLNATIGRIALGALIETAQGGEDVKKSLITSFEQWPEAYPDVVTAIDNANCSCRARLAQLFTKEYTRFVEVLSGFLSSYGKFIDEDVFLNFEYKTSQMIEAAAKHEEQKQLAAQAPNQQVAEISSSDDEGSVSGRVVTVKKKDYGNLLGSLRDAGKGYFGLSVVQSVKSPDSIDVYFY
jgi:hypothetical protein